MAEEHTYVLMLDKERDFIRIFRSDSPMRPSGRVLWQGNGLYRTYEAMKKLNRERRPVICYFVCTEKSADGKESFRVFKSNHPKLWKSVSMHTTYRAAVEEAKRLRVLEKERRLEERRAKEARRVRDRSENEVMLARLRKVGVIRKRVPKLTAKDLRYLEWHEERRRLFEDVA